MARRIRGAEGNDTSTAEHMGRRFDETALDPREAEALAYAEVRRRLRAGEDFHLPTASDIRDFGRELAASPSGRVGGMSSGVGDSLSRAAKTTAESLAIPGGVVVGAVERAGDDAVGAAKTLKFINRLVNPLDPLMSRKGQSAWGKLASGAADALYAAGGAVMHPVDTASAAQRSLRAFRLRTDISARPPSPTFGGMAQRNFDAGRAQGQALFDIATLAAASAPPKIAGKLDRLRAPSGPEKYLRQGYSAEASLYLAEPYKGMGHHVVSRDKKLPSWMGGGPIPKVYSESPFNVLKPEGITRGDMYELHYAADKRFHGARLSDSLRPERWSGSANGLKKAGWGKQQWLGTPTPMKTRAGGGREVVGNVAAGDRETSR